METKNKKLTSLFLGVFISIFAYGQWAETPNNFSSDTDILNGYQLCSFTAKSVEAKTYLIWTTIDKNDNSLYILERSTDNIKFQTIYVKRGEKSPNNIKLMHSFIDKTTVAGIFYYRLKRVTTEGYATSETITINNSSLDNNAMEGISMIVAGDK